MKPVLVLGFYDKHNLGDEMFKETLPKLLPDFQCVFSSVDKMSDTFGGKSATEVMRIPARREQIIGTLGASGLPEKEAPYKAIVCGCGDIFNEYFLKDIRAITQYYRGPVFALGMGIPYPSYMKSGNLEVFDQVFLRNITDLPELTLRLGARYSHYLPDVGFLKPSPPDRDISVDKNSSDKEEEEREIGLFLAQSLTTHPQMVQDVVDLVRYVHQTTKRKIRMIRFNTSGSPHEDDKGIQALIKKSLPSEDVVNDMAVYTTDELISVMSQMAMAICSRFHAHIYATIAGCPFISITPTRKVDLYLKEHHIEELQVSSGKDPKEVFDQIWSDRKLWAGRLRLIAKRNRELLLTGQVNAILHQAINNPSTRRVKGDWINQPSIESIYQSSRKLLFRLTGYDVEDETSRIKIPHEVARQVSAHLCFETTRIPGSKYEYGTTENIMTRAKEMRGMVDWIRKDHLKSSISTLSYDLDYYNQDSLKGLHRSGWNYVLTYLRMFQNKYGLLCDSYVDRTFLWGNWSLRRNGIIPYTSLWFGFIHHTSSTVHSTNNALELINNKEFLQSLPTCRVLICLSDYLTQWFQDRFRERGILVPVVTLYHPTPFVDRLFSLPSHAEFSVHSSAEKPEIRLVNVGAWYRNPFSIYQLKLPGVKKMTLKGREMEDYFPPRQITLSKDPYGNKWLYYLSLYLEENVVLDFSLDSPLDESSSELEREIRAMVASVEIVSELNNEGYDDLLSTSVVFLHLIDASASNTIMECIVRRTPLLVNYHPAIVEYIGQDYPLFYHSLEEIPQILTWERIAEAQKYLSNYNTRHLRTETFMEQLSMIEPLAETFEGVELL